MQWEIHIYSGTSHEGWMSFLDNLISWLTKVRSLNKKNWYVFPNRVPKFRFKRMIQAYISLIYRISISRLYLQLHVRSVTTYMSKAHWADEHNVLKKVEDSYMPRNFESDGSQNTCSILFFFFLGKTGTGAVAQGPERYKFTCMRISNGLNSGHSLVNLNFNSIRNVGKMKYKPDKLKFSFPSSSLRIHFFARRSWGSHNSPLGSRTFMSPYGSGSSGCLRDRYCLLVASDENYIPEKSES